MSPLLSFLEQAALFLVVIGVAVSFHELGHFLAAKALGVRVEVFSIGFGGRIVGRRLGETEYRISAIPLGGYVLMAGETMEEGPRTRHPRDFDSKPLVFRLAIMLAGPVFSALLTVLLMWALFAAGREVPAFLEERPRIGDVAAGSPAQAAGLVPGDLVARIDGAPVPTWERFQEIVATSPSSDLTFGIERGGAPLDVTVHVVAEGKHAIGSIGAGPCVRLIAQTVSAGSGAQAAGILPGDEIAEVAGQEPCTPERLVALVQSTAGGALPVEVRRDGAIVAMTVMPQQDAQSGKWMLGIRPGYATYTHPSGAGQALVQSLRYTRDKASLIVEAFGKLLTGRLSFRSLSGGIEMAGMAKETAEAGLPSFVEFIAFLSLNFAIFNLLPIPILDGGRITLLLLESARGRELERRTKEWILQAGLVMIVVLMLAVLLFDIIKKWG